VSASSPGGAGGPAGKVTVTDAPQAHRYEARSGDDLAGFATYLRAPQLIAFVHTEVEDAYEGHGVGSALARAALDEARAQDLRVVAICPFIVGWIERHPEYQDLSYEPASRVTD
jgi:predicted GNAT family acetyltransferase